MKVIGYIRVSTDEQANNGVSLQAQEWKIRDYCSLYDLELIEIVRDEASGKSLEREGLTRVLSELSRGRAGGVVVMKLDRLTRSVRDLGVLLDRYFDGKQPYHLYSVGEQIDTTSAAGRLVLHILCSVAQWERETIGERTSAALRHMRRNNRFTGGFAPWGFTVDGDGSLVPNNEEQLAIGLAQQWREKGWSLRKIGRALMERGFRSRTGGHLSARQVKCFISAECAV
jgi:site-specific DNA recombinase